MRKLVVVVIVGVLGYYAYGKYRDEVAQQQRMAVETARQASPAAAPYNAVPSPSYGGSTGAESVEPLPPPEPTFDVETPAPAAARSEPASDMESPAQEPGRQCDGRVYCSQMTSCEEATWFLQHCPGTKMDGEGDGVPCERQWCGRR